MIKRAFLGVALFSLLIFAFHWLNSKVPSDGTPVALSTRTSNRHLTIFDTNFLNTNPSEALIQGTTFHETFHVLKSMGFYDIDVPIAAALGYYTEWAASGTLQDKSKLGRFNRGLKGSNLDATVERVMQRYRQGDVTEDMRSYEDGAYLAGVAAQVFGQKAEQATRYMFALAMSLDHHFAVRLARDSKAYDLVTELRRGQFMILDKQQLDNRLSKIDEPMRVDVSRYSDRLLKDYRVLFSTQKDTIYYSFNLQPEDFYREGMKHLEGGEVDRAVEDFSKAIQGDSDFADAYFARGKAQTLRGNSEEALKDLEKAIQLRPDHPEFLTERGKTYGNAGDFKRALADFNTVIELAPNEADGYANRGITFVNMRELNPALTDFNRALSLDSENLDALFGKGFVYVITGQQLKARALFQEFIKKAEGNSAYNQKVQVAQKQLQELESPNQAQ